MFLLQSIRCDFTAEFGRARQACFESEAMVVVWEKKAKAQGLSQETEAKLIQLMSAFNNEVRHQICSPFVVFS